jgi:hypothetical protein
MAIISNEAECFPQAGIDRAGRHESAQLAWKRSLTPGSPLHLRCAQCGFDNQRRLSGAQGAEHILVSDNDWASAIEVSSTAYVGEMG